MAQQHKSEKVEQAIRALSDALIEYNRSTGITSALIIRQSDEFVYRALDGKTGIPEGISDEDIIIQATS